MANLRDRDYFTDAEVHEYPYAYYEDIRSQGPIYQPAGKDYLIVTGQKETLEILNNHHDFSSVVSVQGPQVPLPFTVHGSDITADIETHRMQFYGGNMIVNLDDAAHNNVRALVNRLFTPSRLKANEAYIKELSHKMIADIVAKGGGDMIKDLATPFVTLVISDLLGVPAEDRDIFMQLIDAAPPPGSLNPEDNVMISEDHPMVIMAGYFARYIMERQQTPRDDILSELAHTLYPNGEKPEFADLITLSTFMFGAGQDTSAKLLGNAIRFITDEPGLQDQLRADPSLIPAMLEEVLRLEGSTKQTARLARRDTKIGDYDIKAGTRLLVSLSAANRDPSRWENPGKFQLNRPKIREHVAFGRGKHVCAGAPLARVELRIIFEDLLAQTAHIEPDEEKHGPLHARRYTFEPTFIIRGLAELHLKTTPKQ
jgi:cytochrome P450